MLNIKYIQIGGGNSSELLQTSHFQNDNRRRWLVSSCGTWAAAFRVSIA